MTNLRKAEDIIRLAGRVVDELRWNGAPDHEVDEFINIVKLQRKMHDMQIGSRSLIPQLEDKIIEFGLER